MSSTYKRQRFNRNGFTINNPFLTDALKQVDINNLAAEQEAMPKIEHDYSFMKQPQFEKYFTFAYVEYMKNEVKHDPSTARLVIGERPFF